jgi:long-chain acyl-CoA synthetase
MKTFVNWIFEPNVELNKTVVSTCSGDYTLKAIKTRIEFYKDLLEPCGSLVGKKVGVLVPYIHQYLPLALAINDLGGTITPLAWQLRKKDLHSVLDILEPHVVFTVTEYNGYGFGEVIRLWANSHENEIEMYTSREGNEWTLEISMGNKNSIEYGLPAIISSTSGSTGVPKGIMADINFIQNQVFTHKVALDLKEEDSLFLITPTSSHYGLILLLIGLKMKYRMVIAESYDFPSMVFMLKERPCNKVLTTPSLFRSFYMISNHLAPDVLNNFELVDVTGEHITQDFITYVSHLKGKLISTYGSSEQGSMLYTKGDIRNGIVYTATPGHPFKIADQGENGVGEILFKHENEFKGYYKRPDLTKEAYTEDGWFKSGDLVRVVEENEIIIVGRKKEMIKKGGQQVIPGEIEHLLGLHQQVEQAVVIGVPHKIYGEQVVAYVVGQESLEVESLYRFLSEQVASYKVPDHIFKVDELPINNGKTDKKTLFNKAIEDLGIELEVGLS